MDVIRSLAQACVSCGIGCTALLATLAPEISASIQRDGLPPSQLLLQALCHLNRLSASGVEPNPLLEALKTGQMLAGAYPDSAVFTLALSHLGSEVTVADPTQKRAFLDIWTRQMKEHYEALGYHVTPPLDVHASPFLATHLGGGTSVVTVAYQGDDDSGADLEVAIADVWKWLHLARSTDPAAEGCVVLAPEARVWGKTKVEAAGLTAIDFRARRVMDVDVLESVVQGQLEEVAQGGVAWSFWMGPKVVTASRAMSVFFNDPRARVGLVIEPSGADTEAFSGDMFRVCATGFLKQSSPAPLFVGAGWRSRRLFEQVSEELTRQGHPVTSLTLSSLFREGMLCPVFLCAAPSPSPPATDLSLIARLREGLSDRSKAIVLFSHTEVTTAQRVEISLRKMGLEPRLLRALG